LPKILTNAFPDNWNRWNAFT